MFIQSLLKQSFVICVQNRVLSENPNTSTNRHVPKSNKIAHAFAECSKNQSKPQKLGSVRLFSFQSQMKVAVRPVACAYLLAGKN